MLITLQNCVCVSAGKDKVVKYWDADKFEHLLTLEGHHSEVWCMAVSSLGDFVVTGSHDRSLRRWERTDEPFFVEEEREKRLESLFEADLEVRQSLATMTAESDAQSTGLHAATHAKIAWRPGYMNGAAERYFMLYPLFCRQRSDLSLVLFPMQERPKGRGGKEGEAEEGSVAPAGRKTLETLGAADSITEALEMAANEVQRQQVPVLQSVLLITGRCTLNCFCGCHTRTACFR